MKNTLKYILIVLMLSVFISCKKKKKDSEEMLPEITTEAITNISLNSATGGGNVSDNNEPIIAKGICWSTSQNPSADSGNSTNNGNGSGQFFSTLSNLSQGTTYYVRAYAKNKNGTYYGNEVSFTTLNPVPPVVTTAAISFITGNSAIGGGNISSDGGAPIQAKGICWSVLPGPTIAGLITSDGSGVGGYTSFITGLTSATKYYVRAYATNIAGTAYGQEISFTTP